MKSLLHSPETTFGIQHALTFVIFVFFDQRLEITITARNLKSHSFVGKKMNCLSVIYYCNQLQWYPAVVKRKAKDDKHWNNYLNDWIPL